MPFVWLDNRDAGRVGITNHAVRRFAQRFPARKLEPCFSRAVNITPAEANAAARADKRRVTVDGSARFIADRTSGAVFVLIREGENLRAVTVLRLPAVKPHRRIVVRD